MINSAHPLATERLKALNFSSKREELEDDRQCR
jgi:hypothetical protein